MTSLRSSQRLVLRLALSRVGRLILAAGGNPSRETRFGSGKVVFLPNPSFRALPSGLPKELGTGR